MCYVKDAPGPHQSLIRLWTILSDCSLDDYHCVEKMLEYFESMGAAVPPKHGRK